MKGVPDARGTKQEVGCHVRPGERRGEHRAGTPPIKISRSCGQPRRHLLQGDIAETGSGVKRLDGIESRGSVSAATAHGAVEMHGCRDACLVPPLQPVAGASAPTSHGTDWPDFAGQVVRENDQRGCTAHTASSMGDSNASSKANSRQAARRKSSTKANAVLNPRRIPPGKRTAESGADRSEGRPSTVPITTSARRSHPGAGWGNRLCRGYSEDPPTPAGVSTKCLTMPVLQLPAETRSTSRSSPWGSAIACGSFAPVVRSGALRWFHLVHRNG